MSQWYYAQDDEQIGPLSGAALKELAAEGKLGRDDLIWREGMQRWAPAHKVRGLFPEPAVAKDGQTKHESDSQARDDGVVVDDDRFKDFASSNQNSEEDSSQDDASAEDDPPLEDTAFDELPLVSPEESRLHVPTLGTPDAKRGEIPSSEAVMFEPLPPPSSLDHGEPAASATDSPTPSPAADSTDRTQRVDAPSARVTLPLTLIVQTFLWTNCLAVVLLGGPVVCVILLMTEGLQRRLFISSCYLTTVAMTYVLARTVERMTRLADRYWGTKTTPRKKRRAIAARNRQRFQ